MKNFKTKILNAFRNNNKMDDVIDNISYYQKDLAKNITNPLFDKESKNQMLKISANLNSLRKILQRYENAKQNNNNKVAEEEKENAKNILLKGYISNVKYIWRSEFGEKTCDECASMDGQEFDSVDEIPASPHPNCKCYIEIIEDNDTESNKPTPADTDKNGEKPAETNRNSDNWIMPCHGTISSPYGWRTHPTYGTKKFHNGIDIAVPTGTSVSAIADGIVIRAGKADGYGYFVVIDHGMINGKIVTSEYGHISSWNVKVGQKVAQGEIVAKSGNTGTSTGPHLHITIREGSYRGQAVDPSKYIHY